MSWIQHSALDVFFREGSKNKEVKRAYFIFHGYGANALDLASFSSSLDLESEDDWYFPQAPIELPTSTFQKGYAWFSLENRDWEAFQAGQISDEGFSGDELKVIHQVHELLSEKGKEYSEVIIGGFSQGAILTSHLFHAVPLNLKGLLLFSGYLFHPSSFPNIPSALQVPFFQSHGEQDPVLPVTGAKRLHDHLNQLGLKGIWNSFSGGHEIPMEIIGKARAFIENL